jgi:hypothetical protein
MDDVPLFSALLNRKTKLEGDLRTALAKCEAKYKINADHAFAALTNIPERLLSPLKPLPEIWRQTIIDADAKAMLLRMDKNRWGQIENARWEDLSKAEKRSAMALAGFLGSGRTFIKQRPAEIDYGLAMFLIFTLEELLGRKVPFSRRFQDRLPCGPAFGALLASLKLAHCRATLRQPERSLPTNVEPRALEEILRVTNRPALDQNLHRHGLRRSSACVAAEVHTLLLILGMSRKRMKR